MALLFLVSFGVTGLLGVWLVPVLGRNGLTASNFQNRGVVVAGVIIAFGFMVTWLLALALHPWPPLPLGLYFLAALAFCPAGLADDLLGNRADRGLRGHWRALWRERRLTTGLLKALAGLGGSFLLALLAGSRGPWLVLDTLTVALMANAVNLLDLRPGRALKAFLGTGLLIMGLAGAGSPAAYLWPALGAALAFLLLDLRQVAMLGDAGANLLGGFLGVALLTAVPPEGRVVALALLLLLHWYAEHYSLSVLIERWPLLARLDHLGWGLAGGTGRDGEQGVA